MRPQRTLGIGLPLLAALAFGSPAHSDEPTAVAATRRGDHGAAAGAWHEAARTLEARGDSAGAQQAWVRMAESLQAQGSYSDALPPLERALALARASGDGLAVASIRAARGQLYIALASVADARRELEAALDAAREADATPLVASTLVNLGNVHARGGDLRAALGAYREATSLAAGASDPALEARALANAARAATELEHSEAEALREQATRAIRALPPERDRLELLLHRARTSDPVRESLPHGEAREQVRLSMYGLLTEAAGLAATLEDERSAAYADGYLGALYEAEGRLDEATQLTDRALLHAQRANATEVALRWWEQSARIHARTGRRDSAIEAYSRAVSLLQELRHTLGIDYAASAGALRTNAGSLYHAYVDQLLQRADARASDPNADPAADLRQAQQTMEQLKATELRDYFEDECVDASLARSVDAPRASPTAAILYPILLPDRLEMLVSTGEAIQRARVDVDAETLTASVRELRRLLQKRGTRQYLRESLRLYNWILRPIEPLLDAARVDTLVFVPGGPLRTIPMAALHDGERFLIERYALAVTPGLELTDPRPLERTQLQAFLGGISQGVQGFDALPAVREELRSIDALYDSEMLLDDAFVAGAIESQLASQPFNVVHIASHAQFESSSEGAFVLTHDGRLSMD